MGLDILICVDDTPNQNLTSQASSVEVYEKMDGNTSYKLNFMVDICNEDIAAELQKDSSPGRMLSVLAKVNGKMVCLVKGPVVHQQAQLVHGGAGSWLNVEGEDSGYLMDLETTFRQTPSGSDADIAESIISSQSGMTADVEPTPDSEHNEDNHSHVQRDTDLNLLRTLARRNGYHFWLTWGEDGVATGHFRSRDLEGKPVATLVVNREHYNIDSLRVTADTHRPTRILGRQLDLRTKTDIVGDSVLQDTALGSSSLEEVSGAVPESMHLAPTVDDAGAMAARGKGALRDSQWFITATCSTSLDRLCSVVRYHTIVEVQGAGSRYSGKYYVTGVRHSIDAVAYRMELEMARNAWGN